MRFGMIRSKAHRCLKGAVGRPAKPAVGETKMVMRFRECGVEPYGGLVRRDSLRKVVLTVCDNTKQLMGPRRRRLLCNQRFENRPRAGQIVRVEQLARLSDRPGGAARWGRARLRVRLGDEQRQAQKDRPETASIRAEHGAILSERLQMR